MSKLNQKQLVLHLLKKAKNTGVTNYTFANHHILRYSSQIFTLRSEGYNITCKRLLLKNGRVTNVFKYYLIEEK